MRRLGVLFTLVIAIALGATAGFAQDGKLKIKVTPKQAYVFVDGNAIREGNQSISLTAGKHTVVVVNYGYKFSTQDVNMMPERRPISKSRYRPMGARSQVRRPHDN